MSTLVFDIESHNADLLYSMSPDEFVRLIGFKLDQEDVYLTTELDELKEAIRQSDWIIGHNIHDFDLRATFGIRSNEPLQLTDEGRVYDTWTHAVLVNPAPYIYTNRFGKQATAAKPEQMKKWFALDEQAHQLGVPGKTHDLKELAKEFGDPDLGSQARIRDGFGKIPVDDPRYREYLVGDVLASEHVAKALLKLGPLDEYALREQRIDARKAVISSNGFRVDIHRAEERVAELAKRRDEVLAWLVDTYGFPTEGEAPWDTTEGKRAIMAALKDYGITPEAFPDWPKTPTWDKREAKKAENLAKADALQLKVREWSTEIGSGELSEYKTGVRNRWIDSAVREITQIRNEPLPPAFGLSLGGKELVALTADTEAAELGVALAELKGQRSLAQLALDSCHPDGFVHPEITMLQRSGRWSTTKPGLTVWTARGDGAVEKEYFIPDNEDEVLLEIDYSNADARVVAAYSGDTKYAERFEPGQDGHMLNALAAWGEDIVSTDPKKYRQMAKPLGHGWSYGGGAKTLSRQAGVPYEDAKTFCDGMASEYRVLVAWQNRVRRQVRNGIIRNYWGRPMRVEPGREFTQAPALMGQSGTREIVCDVILDLPIHWLRRIKAQIHDALVFSVPRDSFTQCRDYLLEKLHYEWNPPGGQPMSFPVEAGPPGDSWFTAGH